MLGRILKMFANDYLKRRAQRTGSGPSRLPPTSMREAQHRAAHSIVRSIMNRFMKR